MRYNQTDVNFNDNINKYGCLFFSLMDIAEEYTGHNFILRSIRDLYTTLNGKTFISYGKEYPIMDKDCYVNNHMMLLQEALEVLGCHDKVTYSGARYFNGRESWGKKYGMYMIQQFKTKNGNGHFFRNHYDPYLPEIKFTNIISIRYYNIGI